MGTGAVWAPEREETMQTGPLMKIGRYEMREEIASGGMATVYRAIQTGVGGVRSVVAVKILHAHLAKEAEYRKMFLEEARIGALLQHKCLLNVLDYGEEEGISFIVTEYFPSLSLEDLVAKVGPVPLPEALYILSQAAEGLHALHEARDLEGKKLGLIHRDVSPQNVLVGHDGRVKVIDYGIIKRKDPTERTMPGIVKGKCRYMSPEQAVGGTLEPPSDIFALGVVMLRILSGAKPHGDGSTSEIMARARDGLDVRKSLGKASVPTEVLAFLERMLALDPEDRFSTGADVAREARRLLGTLQVVFDPAAFEAWVGELAGTRASIRPRRRRKAEPKPEADEIKDVRPGPRPALDGGVHPRWVAAGLGLLFLFAVVAHLADTWM
jgi:serine/threonine-protein kinase